MIKVFIVDDHDLIIKGIKYLLENQHEIKIINSANSAKETLEKLEIINVDLILLDINLPDLNGIELCKKIKIEYPNIKIIALSNYSQISYIQDMMLSGADGYLLKNIDNQELINAIKKVYNGKKILSQDINQIIFNKKPEQINLKITRREQEILSLVSEGLTSNQIANKLNISSLTAETHRKNLLLKFEVSNTAQLIKKAIQLNFIY